MAKVLIPYAGTAPFLPSVKLAVMLDGYEPDLCELKEDEDYYNLLSRTWEQGDPFIIVEEDIVPWPGALKELIQCPEPWCTFPYHSAIGWLKDGLGCAKFNPQALPSIRWTDKHWRTLDCVISKGLTSQHFFPHVHMPGVSHLNLSVFYSRGYAEVFGFQLRADQGKLIPP